MKRQQISTSASEIMAKVRGTITERAIVKLRRENSRRVSGEKSKRFRRLFGNPLVEESTRKRSGEITGTEATKRRRLLYNLRSRDPLTIVVEITADEKSKRLLRNAVGKNLRVCLI